MLPPLGLITVAAMLPREWPVRLADLNVRALDPAELDWADVVFVSGMLIQRESLHAVAREARAHGKRVVAGGAYASTSPDALAAEVDCVVVGEAESLMPALVGGARAAAAALPARLKADDYPDVRTVPTPRYELLDVVRLPIDGRAVEPRLSVQLRVLRHHRDLRAPRAHQDAGAAPRRARRHPCHRLSRLALHRRRQLHRQQGRSAAPARPARRLDARARRSLLPLHRGEPEPRLRRRAHRRHGRRRLQLDLHRHRDAVGRGAAPHPEAAEHHRRPRGGRRQADGARPRGDGRVHRRLRHRRRRGRRAAARVDRPLADPAGDGGPAHRAAVRRSSSGASSAKGGSSTNRAATTSCAPTS